MFAGLYGDHPTDAADDEDWAAAAAAAAAAAWQFCESAALHDSTSTQSPGDYNTPRAIIIIIIIIIGCVFIA